MHVIVTNFTVLEHRFVTFVDMSRFCVISRVYSPHSILTVDYTRVASNFSSVDAAVILITAGALKMREWKMQEWKMQEQTAKAENAGVITYGKPSEDHTLHNT